MKLIVTRHAKSSWDDPYLRDHDRPLAKRGRRASKAIGNWLAKKNHIPKIVLSSTSVRTQQTWERIERCIPGSYDVQFISDLYHGGTGSICGALSTVDDSPVLILGHNPGIGFFASAILKSPPVDFKFRKYPTAATLVCELPVENWNQIQLGTAELIDFVVPRDLE